MSKHLPEIKTCSYHNGSNDPNLHAICIGTIAFNILPVYDLTTVLNPKYCNEACVTVWCGFWTGGIIRPYFYENEASQAVTIILVLDVVT
ncbi:unnamed protein product [Euphydryas editha]|uniref:Uncharacterized protein n=1 Tax=Euphydryas editha TaxID=104508 RepID=A0AAU9VFD4_EUPED|nr:unnamed protein product [Euphydryas editha]